MYSHVDSFSDFSLVHYYYFVLHCYCLVTGDKYKENYSFQVDVTQAKIEKKGNINNMNKENVLLFLDYVDEQDQKQFVRIDQRYFHLFYNLFQNKSYYFD